MPDSFGSELARHVLVVEDESVLLEEVTEYLAWAGWQVEGVGDAAAAAARLAADRRFTVLLTDIRLPGVDGITLARQAWNGRAEAEAIEVVLFTGHGTIEEAVEGIRAGVFDFVRKPVALATLHDVLRRAHAATTRRRMAEAARAAEVARLRAAGDALRARLGDDIDGTDGVSEEVAGILSHELRTPLVALLGVPELLSAPAGLSAGAVRAQLDAVRQAGARLTAIADDFVELIAPPTAGSFNFECTTPEWVLARLHTEAGSLATRSDRTLRTICSARGVIETDLARLVQALMRLVANAVVWSPAGSEVVVLACDEGPDHVALEVVDHGCGMTEDEIAIARRPFRQLDMSPTRPVGGLGLGLPLAERMAQRLGGALRLVSTVGTGTVASIVLPRGHVSPEGEEA
jgi:signal transduction histidine kinase